MKKYFEDYLEKYIYEYGKDYSQTKVENKRVYKRFSNQENDLEGFCHRIDSEVSILKGKILLDVGCGPGGRSVALALKGAHVIGVEPLIDGTKASICRADRHFGIKANFLVGKGEDLPFKDNTFDVVTSVYVLHHTKNISKNLSEIYRVLKKGGYFYCELPNNFFLYEDHYQIFWFSLMPKWLAKIYLKIKGKDYSGLDTFEYITRRNAVKCLKDKGFKDIKNININYVKEKIENIELIENPLKRKLVSFLKRIRFDKLVIFLTVKFDIFPAIYIITRKT